MMMKVVMKIMMIDDDKDNNNNDDNYDDKDDDGNNHTINIHSNNQRIITEAINHNLQAVHNQQHMKSSV